MSKIKQLSTQEAQKIAAGEVIERPANIVKELLENALDAHASHITIHVENGGKKRIQVVDNGDGMDETDAHLCFEHHATSKIDTVDDLQTINTFGFRGEALSSISAVSKVTLITKQKDAIEGIQVKREGPSLISQDEISANSGTDITIDDIFYNVPARKKFLKTKETEWRHIQQLFFATALQYTNVHFKLYSEGRLLYNCPPITNINDRWQQLSDVHIHTNMIPLSYTSEHTSISLSGTISTPQHGKYDRSGIYFFVNKRWVKNYLLSKAFIDGYKNVLPPHQYPSGAIMISIDPAEIDVNIHPRKEEVQFLHPHKARDSIKQAVNNALEQHISAQLQKPTTIAAHDDTGDASQPLSTPPLPLQSTTKDSSTPFVPFNFDSTFISLAEKSPLSHNKYNALTQDKTQIQEALPTQQYDKKQCEKKAQKSAHDHVYSIIGILHKTYILVEQEDGILVVDQHAAHERILYERFIQERTHTTVQLLFPQTIQLSAHDCLRITPYLHIFVQSGIEVEQFSETQLVVKSIPVSLKNASIEAIIYDALSWLSQKNNYEGNEIEEQLKKAIHADIACKAAVKAGDTLSDQEVHTLLNDLHTTPNRFSCPHGRPTTWHMPLDMIKKKFKRDYRSE